MTRPEKRAQRIQTLRRQIKGYKARHRITAIKQSELVSLVAQQLRYEMRQRG